MRGAVPGWTGVFAALLLQAGVAAAQTPAELAEARKTFASALADEEQANFEAALEKFRRVQAVRETVAVRYRIGACLEALGRWKEAIVAYEGAIALGSSGDAKNAESIKAAREKVTDLSKRLPRLTVSLAAGAPADAVVELDREAVPPATFGAPIALNPGSHVIAASAPGAVPFRTELTLAEGAHLALVIPLAPIPPPVVEPPKPPPGPPPEPPHPHRTVGLIALGAGAVLLVGAGVAELVRHGNISDLRQACPNGLCPAARETELRSTRSHAITEGVLAAVLAGTGVVAGGVGAYFLFFADRHAPVVTAAVSDTDARILLRGSF